MKIPILLVVTLMLAGCATGGAPPAEIYDFGIARSAAPPAGQDVFVAEVAAADWLNSTDMLYRLEYRNPRVLAPYSASRWAGSPAAMLTVRLRETVGNGAYARRRQAKCNLTLFLSEFSQVFRSERDSRALLHVSATLTGSAAGGQPLVREFRMEQPAPTPNAAGAAVAFADIATRLADALNAWINEAGICRD